MPGDLVGAWAFNASPVPDESGGGRTITLSGGTVLTSVGNGAFGTRGLTQTGAETFTAFTLPPELQTPQRTWMANVVFTGSTIGWIGEFYRAGTDNTGVWGLLDLRGAASTLQFRAKDSSNVERHINLTAPSVMTNICATYDGTNLRLYIDGVLSGTLAIPAIWDADSFRLLDNADTVCRIDDMRLFNGALTQEEIDAWRVLPADQFPPPPGTPGRLKIETAPGVWTPVPLKFESAPGVWTPVPVKTETSPGVWTELP